MMRPVFVLGSCRVPTGSAGAVPVIEMPAPPHGLVGSVIGGKSPLMVIESPGCAALTIACKSDAPADAAIVRVAGLKTGAGTERGSSNLSDVSGGVVVSGGGTGTGLGTTNVSVFDDTRASESRTVRTAVREPSCG